MEEFKPTKIDLSTINNGKGKYNNGDGIQADIINSVIEASAWAQSLGTNQPNIENIDKEGEPSVSIETTENGAPRLKFENLKGKKGTDGKDAVVDKTLSVVGASADAKATGDRFAVVEKNNEKQDASIKTLFSGLLQAEIIRAVEDVENTSIIRQTADGLSVIDGSQSTVNKIQGKTVKSTNLFDMSKITGLTTLKFVDRSQYLQKNNDGTITIKLGGTSANTVFSGVTMFLPVGEYTVSAVMINNESFADQTMFSLLTTDGTTYYQNRVASVAANTSKRIFYTFSVERADYYYLGVCPTGNTSNSNNLNISYAEIQLEQGSTATPFTPYFDGLKNAQISGIKSVSNLLKWKGRTKRISTNVAVATPRILSEDDFWEKFSLNGYWAPANYPYGEVVLGENSIKVASDYTNAYGLGLPVKCFANTQYTFSVIASETTPVETSFQLGATYYDKDGIFMSYNQAVGDITSLTFTTPVNAEWVVLGVSLNAASSSVEISDLMLNYGSTALPYREYEESIMQLPENTELGEWDSIDGTTLTKGTSEILTLNGTEGLRQSLNAVGWSNAEPNSFDTDCIKINYMPPQTVELKSMKTPITNNPYKGLTAWEYGQGAYEGVYANDFVGANVCQIGVQLKKSTIGLVNGTTYTTEQLTTAMLNYIKANPLTLVSLLTTPIVTELDIGNEYLVWNKGQEKMLLKNTDAVPMVTNDYYIVLGG